MALLIFPIGVVLGLLIRSPRWAAAVTAALGLGSLAVLAVLWVRGVEISPLEVLVLLIGTPIAAVTAFKVAQWRASRGAVRR